MMHLFGKISLKDLNWKSRPYSAWLAYGQSKLANLPFTQEIAAAPRRGGSPVKSLAAHPGYSSTNLQAHTGNQLGTRFWDIGNTCSGDERRLRRPPDPCTRLHRTCPATATSGLKFGMRGPTAVGPRSRLASNADTATGVPVGAVRAAHRHRISGSEALIG